ncbi:methyltransferase domain-containing protein [Rhodomicrobium vannielii ATCC 17100]|nr:methyltransferase domain-containing protein [Rhodomicrobium vannielii ATCC 17100]
MDKRSNFNALMDRAFAFRDRVLSSPRFIRFAETFPLTRPIARREAGALFDLCSGFIYSQVLLSCVRLGLFEHLRGGPLARDEIARRLGLGEDATARLLTAAVALRLAEERSGGRYGLGRLGAAVLASPGLTAMVEHHGLVYRDLEDPVALLRGETKARDAGDAANPAADKGTHLASYWPYAEGDTSADRDAVSAYTALMAATQPAIAEEVLDAYDFMRHRCLMDVGGGDGTFLRAAARRVPALDLVLFDMPAVADLADAKFKAANLAHRARTAGGDFTKELPKGADIVTLVRVLLDHDDDTALKTLTSVRAALPQGGVLVIAEPMAGTRGAEKVAAYFSLYLMAMGRGRPRTEAQLRDLLQRAGFTAIKRCATRQPLLVRVLAATF